MLICFKYNEKLFIQKILERTIQFTQRFKGDTISSTSFIL